MHQFLRRLLQGTVSFLCSLWPTGLREEDKGGLWQQVWGCVNTTGKPADRSTPTCSPWWCLKAFTSCPFSGGASEAIGTELGTQIPALPAIQETYCLSCPSQHILNTPALYQGTQTKLWKQGWDAGWSLRIPSASAPVSFPKHWSLGKVQASWKSMLLFALHFNAGTSKGLTSPTESSEHAKYICSKNCYLSIYCYYLNTKHHSPYLGVSIQSSALAAGRCRRKYQNGGPKD